MDYGQENKDEDREIYKKQFNLLVHHWSLVNQGGESNFIYTPTRVIAITYSSSNKVRGWQASQRERLLTCQESHKKTF